MVTNRPWRSCPCPHQQKGEGNQTARFQIIEIVHFSKMTVAESEIERDRETQAFPSSLPFWVGRYTTWLANLFTKEKAEIWHTLAKGSSLWSIWWFVSERKWFSKKEKRKKKCPSSSYNDKRNSWWNGSRLDNLKEMEMLLCWQSITWAAERGKGSRRSSGFP